jgi:hypothetical protein
MGVGLSTDESRDTIAAPIDPSIILDLRQMQAQLSAIIRAQNRMNNPVRALVRRCMGFESRMVEEDREAIAKAAAIIVDAVEAGEPVAAEHADVARVCTPFILCNVEARKTFDNHRGILEKRMEKVAEALPVAPWVEGVRGFGFLSLARIIGETGDLSNYSNPGKVWKRMGLAPFNGKAASTWKASKPSLSSDEWIDLGYSPSRRSVMFVVGDVLIKVNRDGAYRKAYDERKTYELARQPDMRPIIAHRRAQRYMEKRLLRDLWIQWNKGGQRGFGNQRKNAA